MTQVKAADKRLEFLDITKGFLVALMVIYHSLNYTNQYQLAFRFLSFLPPSFILITGFLIARVYYPRAANGEPGLTSRLILRGLRLLTLFVVLNIVSQFVRSPAYGRSIGVEAFFQQWQQIFLWGGSRMAVFEVLLPIAYLIIFAPLVLYGARQHSFFLPLFTGLIIGTCFFFEYRGQPVANLRFMGVGLIGMLAGRWLSDPSSVGRGFWASFVALGAYVGFAADKGYLYVVQLCGAIAALVFFCGVSMRLGWFGLLARRLAIIGQYSLLAYIVQIAALQLLSRFLGRPAVISLSSLCYFSATTAIMILSIEVARWLRARSPHADRTYKLIFA